MISFLLKKNFLDGWDNVLKIGVFNIFLSCFAIGLYYLAGLLVYSEFTATIAIICGIIIFYFPVFMINEMCARVANSQSISFEEVLKTFPLLWKDCLLFSLIVAGILLLITIGVPFYMSFDNLLGLFFAAFTFWIACIVTLSMQWFLPLRAQLKTPFRKTLKKSFMLFFDNCGFSLFLFFYNLVLFIFSASLAFIAPGITGILIAQNNALKLRMYKYDWLEEHPAINTIKERKNIPWDALLANDKEKIGSRTLKDLFFPWT